LNLIDENELSELIKGLLSEASAVIAPGEVRLSLHDNLTFNVDVQTVVESNGDYTIYIKPETIHNEYKISHEILHIIVRRLVPNFVRVLEPNIVGMIGSELQGYLEHGWILAEQKRRGLVIDELGLYPDIEETIGSDEKGLETNFNRIMILNTILHIHPLVFEKHKDFFSKNNPKSLEIAQKIMSHYPKQELYSNYEARKATVSAIKEWNSVFRENGLKHVNLNILLSVVPVFSAAQLKRTAGVILGMVPNAIVNHEKRTASHVLLSLSDGQCCVVFSMDENGLKALENYLQKMTLEEFLQMARMPYLLR